MLLTHIYGPGLGLKNYSRDRKLRQSTHKVEATVIVSRVPKKETPERTGRVGSRKQRTRSFRHPLQLRLLTLQLQLLLLLLLFFLIYCHFRNAVTLSKMAVIMWLYLFTFAHACAHVICARHHVWLIWYHPPPHRHHTVSVIADHYDWRMKVRPNACARYVSTYFYFYAGSVRVGRGTISQYYIIYAYVVWRSSIESPYSSTISYMQLYCESHPLNLSTLTLHRPDIFRLFPPTHFACTVSVPFGDAADASHFARWNV